MLLKPQRVDLDHRAYFLRGSLDNHNLVLADKQGRVTFLDSQLHATHSLSFPGITGISPDPTGRLLAIVSGDPSMVTIHRLDGMSGIEIDPPKAEDDDSICACLDFLIVSLTVAEAICGLLPLLI